VPVGIYVAPEPVDLIFGERIGNVGGTLPGLMERQLPSMDEVSAHVNELRPRAFDRRVQRESIAGLGRLIFRDRFLRHTAGNRIRGTAALVPGLRAPEGLVKKIVG